MSLDPVAIITQRIDILQRALVDLSVITDENYPALRSAILTVGGDDFVNGIRISLPDVVVAIPVLDDEGNPVLDDDGLEVVEFETRQQDPYEIEKTVLIAVIKTVLQVSYTTRWLHTPL